MEKYQAKVAWGRSLYNLPIGLVSLLYIGLTAEPLRAEGTVIDPASTEVVSGEAVSGEAVSGEAVAVEVVAVEVVAAEVVAAEVLSGAQAGYDFLEKGWVNDAIEAFQAALANQPDSLEAKLGLAIAYQRAGEDEQAWNAYGAVLEQDAQQIDALRAVGTMGSYRPDWQPIGIDALDGLLQLQPGDVEMRAQRALLLGYQQRFESAIADYEILLAPETELPSPLESQVWINAAQIYTYSDRTAEALPLFERYRNSGGSLEQPAKFAYATALRKQGRSSEAIAMLTDIKPQNSDEAFDRLLALALAHQDNDNPQEALFILKPALVPLPEEPQRRRAIANALVPIQSPPPELLPVFQELLLDPDPVTFLHFRAGQIQLVTGDWDGARDSLLAYQASTPDLDLGTEFLLAEIDRQDGDLEASGERYARLFEIAEGEQQLDALRGIAAIRFEQQRLIEAEGLYRELIARRPDDVEARRTFAELLLAKDQPKEALSQFSIAQDALSASASTTASIPESDPENVTPLATADRSTQSDEITLRQRTIRRGFLRRRGFQPRWERF